MKHKTFLTFHVSALMFCGFATTLNAAPQIQASTDFPGGSSTVLSIGQTNNFIRITPGGDPKQGWPCWWYLRLDGVDTNQPLVLEVVGNQATVGEKPGQTKRLNADWSLPAQAAFSTDGTTWEHTAPGDRHGSRSVYHVNTSSPRLWLAWGPPFTLQDANQLIEKVCHACPDAQSFVLAQTRGNRPVPGVRITQSGTAAGERSTVWIQARQHAWESGSSWVARGFLDWLVSQDPAAESLRQKADFVVIPIVDVDSVEQGQGGKQQQPHDQNGDWGAGAYFPEVQAGMEKLSALAKADRLDLFLDLHNPGITQHSIMFYIPPVPLLLPERVTNEDIFLKIVREQMTGSIPYLGDIGPCGNTYDPAVDKSVDTWVAAQSQPRVVSLTMETPWNNPDSTPAGYLKVGEQTGRCIDLYLRSPRKGSP